MEGGGREEGGIGCGGGDVVVVACGGGLVGYAVAEWKVLVDVVVVRLARCCCVMGRWCWTDEDFLASSWPYGKKFDAFRGKPRSCGGMGAIV